MQRHYYKVCVANTGNVLDAEHTALRWEFRAEAFDAFNTPHSADPDTNVADGAAFGVISKTMANPRMMELALKYRF
jgi:hypothetical protein